MTRKTVFITGAAKRIGATLARHLHAQGMNVVIHYHSSKQQAIHLRDELNDLKRESAFIINGDLLQTDSYGALIPEITDFTGRLDVLINNASLFYPTPVGHTTHQQWTDLVGTNMMAPYFLAQACHQYLKKNNGCIINITDIYGTKPLKNHPVYSAAKAGLIMLTRALARELGPEIRVNAISPGAILWPESLADDQKQQIISKSVLKREGAPEDIASAARFLIEDADYITGQVINVDGGRFD
jgi:pteridine reductase